MSTSNWPACIDFVLEHEGGAEISDHPDDPGGLTRWGISERAHPGLDILHLTQIEAEAIYQRDYWFPCACDRLPYPVSLAVFDYAVNSGQTVAKKALQRAAGAEPDGHIGPKTMQAVEAIHPDVIAARIVDARLAYYISVVRRKPASLVFLKGWMRRLIHLTRAIYV